jgi:hypothetical protein
LRKVLFLDIDGVLFIGVSKGDGLYASDLFDAKCVDALNRILTETKCEMVITSTWQNDFDLEQLKNIFAANGIRSPPSAVSSIVDGGFVVSTERANDILKWLAINNASNAITWCAVDDSDLSSSIKNFVKCDSEIGLKDPSVVSNVLEILKE